MANNMYTFDLPLDFTRASATSPTTADYRGMLREKVPAVVHQALLMALPRWQLVHPMIAFVMATEGYLPPFVVHYFMSVQEPPRPISNITRFIRAIRLMEAYRAEYFRQNPPTSDPMPQPAQPLPAGAMDAFFRCVQASFTRGRKTGTFDPLGSAQAEVFLQEMRTAVRGSAPTHTGAERTSSGAQGPPTSTSGPQDQGLYYVFPLCNNMTGCYSLSILLSPKCFVIFTFRSAMTNGRLVREIFSV